MSHKFKDNHHSTKQIIDDHKTFKTFGMTESQVQTYNREQRRKKRMRHEPPKEGSSE